MTAKTKVTGAEEFKSFVDKIIESTRGIDEILLSFWQQFEEESRLRKLAEEKYKQVQKELDSFLEEKKQIRKEAAILRSRANDANNAKLSAMAKLQKANKELTHEKATLKMLKMLLTELLRVAVLRNDKDIISILEAFESEDEQPKEDVKQLLPEDLPTYSEFYKREIIYHNAFLADYESLNLKLKKSTLNSINLLATEGCEYNSLNSKILHNNTKNSIEPPWCGYINKKWRLVWEITADNITIVEIMDRKNAYRKVNLL